MAELTDTKEVDLLNLPDDEIPDYPPGEEPETVTEAPDESEITNEDEDIEHDDNETESDLGVESGEQPDSEAENEEGENDSGEEREDDDDDVNEESESGSDSTEDNEEASSEKEDDKKEDNQEEVTAESKEKDKGNKETTETDVPGLSPEQQLKTLFAPFKANGRDMQVSTVADAITLMKMGANYNKKMQGLKPNLRLMKMLDNNELLDEEKLTYLIDLKNKNPQAIAKLLKDSGVDPMSYEEDNTDYTPGTYTVNEKEVDLDMVLEEIKDTPSFQKTIDTISNKWDAGSRKLAQDDPNIIRIINEHIDNGTYEPIMDIVHNEKALGRLTELSDLQAYKHVGETLQAQGAFAPQPAANEKKTITKKPQDPKLKNRKKAAANTRSKPVQKQRDFHPLDLPDEEFAKLDPTLL